MDLFTDATQHQQFFDLSYKLTTTTTTTKHYIDHYVKPNSENGPLHKIRHDELAKNMGPQICKFANLEGMLARQRIGIHMFLRTEKFGVLNLSS